MVKPRRVEYDDDPDEFRIENVGCIVQLTDYRFQLVPEREFPIGFAFPEPEPKPEPPAPPKKEKRRGRKNSPR